jgi:uncharacterized protein YoaH (UPF0181 family)
MTMITLAVLILGAGGLGAQETPRARAQGVLPADVFRQVDAMAGSAEQDGIPGDILFNKALEGAAKGVPADRLPPAVQAYALRLREARMAFGPEVRGPMLVAGADALQRGVGVELLRGLGRERERSPIAVLVLADLVESGVANDHALGLVREAMQRRAREQQMLDMPAQVRRLMRQGMSAGDAVEQVRRALQRGRGGGMIPPVAPGSEPMTRTRRGSGG